MNYRKIGFPSMSIYRKRKTFMIEVKTYSIPEKCSKTSTMNTMNNVRLGCANIGCAIFLRLQKMNKSANKNNKHKSWASLVFVFSTYLLIFSRTIRLRQHNTTCILLYSQIETSTIIATKRYKIIQFDHGSNRRIILQ